VFVKRRKLVFRTTYNTRRIIMNRNSFVLGLVLCFVIIFGGGKANAAQNQAGMRPAILLTSGLVNGSGSTVGPDGALYVTEGATGSVLRVDPQTANTTTFATGLPGQIFPIGGATDIAFIDDTAYVLVTLVGPELGGHTGDVVGIYRVDGPNQFTVIADIGAWSLLHPPVTPFFAPTGVQYAIQSYRGGFLVTDGHHNRVLRVTLNGEISELITFGNIVPTGLEVWGNRIYIVESGPVPHNPQDGKVVSFDYDSPTPIQVASGVPLLVDVEFGLGRKLYALSNGVYSGGGEGSPGLSDTGSLIEVNADGTFTAITTGLDRPTSLEFIGNTAYVITLTGEIWKIDDVSNPPFGGSK
jgi:hypothetical protein